MPWLNVPRERLSNMVVQPLHARGGLLGGSSGATSGKPSKLAALAAARKKAQLEKKNMTANDMAPQSEESAEQDKTLTMLDRLTVKARASEGNQTPSVTSKRKGGSDESPKLQDQQRSYPRRKKDTKDEEEPRETILPAVPVNEQAPQPPPESLRATPSNFAQTVMGNQNAHISQHMTEDKVFSLQYVNDKQETNKAFAGPSPDDVVANAQSKGLRN